MESINKSLHIGKIKEIITDIVRETPAIKGVNLIVELYKRYNVFSVVGITDGTDLVSISINQLVDEGNIIELGYITREMDYREKSIYFPRGTGFNFKPRKE